MHLPQVRFTDTRKDMPAILVLTPSLTSVFVGAAMRYIGQAVACLTASYLVEN